MHMAYSGLLETPEKPGLRYGISLIDGANVFGNCDEIDFELMSLEMVIVVHFVVK